MKLRFLNTCVCTVARFRWSRWPYTKVLADRLDSIQRRCIYSLFPLRRLPHEELTDFFSRRHRTAARNLGPTGKWSRLWESDLINCKAHVDRKHDPDSWSPHLLSWMGHHWLSLRRLWHSAFGESRTNTRIFRGHVHRRWEEGLKIAKSI